MPSERGTTAPGDASYRRLARFFQPDADPWECLQEPVPPGVFGLASRRAFTEYFRGPSRVLAKNLETLCDWLRGCQAIDDPSLFRVPDHWQHPAEFEVLRRGDCEDHALWAWRRLCELGLRARFVTGLWRDTPHAWVQVHLDGADHVLEAMAKTGPMLLPLPAARASYCPAVAVDHRLQTFVYQGFQRLHQHTDSHPHPPAPGSTLPADFEVAILAGGRSSRMGQDKARLRFAGSSLLSRIRSTARTLGRPIRVIRRDSEPGHGPVGGMLTALERARSPVVLVLACDMPAVTPALLCRVLDSIPPSTLAAFSVGGDGRPGFPLALRRTLRPDLREFIQAGHRSLRELAERLKATRVRVKRSEEHQLANLNTPEELAIYREKAPAGGSRARAQGSLLALGLALLLGFPSPRLGASPAPPAETWLPAETTAFLSVPDMARARALTALQGPGLLWKDPAMAPLRARFEENLRARLWDPLQAASGLAPGDILALAEGQFTLAAIRSPGKPATHQAILLLDAGAQAADLDALLSRTLQPSTPALPVRPWHLGGSPAWSIVLEGRRLEAILEAAFPSPAPAPPSAPAPAPVVLHLARSRTLLLATTASTNVLAEALARLTPSSGTNSPPLPNRYPALARESRHWSNTLAQAWIAAAPALEALTESTLTQGTDSLLGPIRTDRLLAALGLKEVQAVSAALRADPSGWSTELRLVIPEGARRGLFGIVAPIAADASPPAWVGSDALSFRRLRIPGPAAWAALERTLLKIDPAVLGVLQLFTQYAGRTEDADFSFDRDLVGRLGDDWMAVSYPADNPDALDQAMLVHGSTNAAPLSHAFGLVASPTYLATFTPPGTPAPARSERTVSGFPVLTIGLPKLPWQDSLPQEVHLAARDRWVALAGSMDVMKTLLAPIPTRTPLASVPAFQDALHRVGGGGHGWLAYRLERETARYFLERVRTRPATLQSALEWAAFSDFSTRLAAGLVSWVDPGLIPGFDRIARYFDFSVEGGRVDPEALTLTTFRPAPARPVAPPMPPVLDGRPPVATTPSPAQNTNPSSGQFRLE